jgi:hypothetical protein
MHRYILMLVVVITVLSPTLILCTDTMDNKDKDKHAQTVTVKTNNTGGKTKITISTPPADKNKNSVKTLNKENKKLKKELKKTEKKIDKNNKKIEKKKKKKKQEKKAKNIQKKNKQDKKKQTKITVKSKDGKKVKVTVKAGNATVVTGPYRVKKGAKIIDEDKVRHQKLLKRINELEGTLKRASKRMHDLTDENFRDNINFQLESLLNKIQYKGDVVVKVKRPPPKDPIDFRGEMQHRKESKKRQIKRINQIIKVGNVPLPKHTIDIDPKVVKISKLKEDHFKKKNIVPQTSAPSLPSKQQSGVRPSNGNKAGRMKRRGRAIKRKDRKAVVLDKSSFERNKRAKTVLQV